MNDKDFTEIFEKTNALMYGHFILSSGLRSDAYFQCAKVLQYPEYLTMFGEILSNHFKYSSFLLVLYKSKGIVIILGVLLCKNYLI